MMSLIKIKIILLITATTYFSGLFPVIIDNRYFPLYHRVFLRTLDRKSRAECDLFFTTTKEALDEHHETIGLPELYGPFDQRTLSAAIERVGLENPLRIDLRNSPPIIWKTNGKLNAEGFNLYMEKSVNDYVSVGFTTGFMHANSRISFPPPLNTISTLRLGERGFMQLDAQRREAFNVLGLQAPEWSDTQLLDSELFVRFGKIWEYTLKTRRLDLNGQVGFIFPGAKQRDINNPASIPFGGNRHKGIAASVSLDIELKEDLSFGIAGMVNKRFDRTAMQRMPVLNEPFIYGALVDCAQVSPGFTVGFSPYLIAQELRDGLGAYARYVYIRHLCDSWADRRGPGCIPARLSSIVGRSAWTSEYFSFNIFYDIDSYNEERTFYPRASVAVDIPVEFLGARLTSKTYRVSLGCEFSF